MDARGIYITSSFSCSSSERVTGHYVSTVGGRHRVHTFKNCSLENVMEAAREVIHEPKVYRLMSLCYST